MQIISGNLMFYFIAKREISTRKLLILIYRLTV